MLNHTDARFALSLAAALSLSIFATAGANAQGVGMDYKGNQTTSPSEMTKQPQLNQIIQKPEVGGNVQQNSSEVIIPPGIKESVRVGELQDVSGAQRTALGFLMGFNLLATIAWLFAAGKAEIKMDRFFHGDPLNTGKRDMRNPAANPVTGH